MAGLTDLIFRVTQGKIGSVTLDASIKEVHSGGVKVTRHPIEAESGQQSNVSDHVHVDPLMVQINGFVTNTPAEFPSLALELTEAGTKDLVEEAYQALFISMLEGKIVEIVTSLVTYSNMVVESIKVDREASKGNALYVNISAAQISLVSSEEIDVGQRPVAESTKQSGKKSKEEATEADTTRTSAIHSFGKGSIW